MCRKELMKSFFDTGQLTETACLHETAGDIGFVQIDTKVGDQSRLVMVRTVQMERYQPRVAEGSDDLDRLSCDNFEVQRAMQALGEGIE